MSVEGYTGLCYKGRIEGEKRCKQKVQAEGVQTVDTARLSPY